MPPSATTTLALACTALACAASLPRLHADRIFVARVPNGANVNGITALGHANTIGDGPLNAFGRAFEKAGKKWTRELCRADSDGDGQTNGQELGDPCCQWTKGATPSFTDGVSHPGNATSKADATLWASVSCASSTGTSPAVTTSAPSTAPAPVPVPAASAAAAAASVSVSVSVVVAAAALVLP